MEFAGGMRGGKEGKGGFCMEFAGEITEVNL